MTDRLSEHRNNSWWPDWDPSVTLKMAFIQVENGDMETVETSRVKEEETEEQTGWFHS